MISIKNRLYAVLVVFIVINSGCSVTRTGPSKYWCVNNGTCNLPEEIEDGQALIYLIRPYRLFNQSEKHDLYLKEGEEREVSYARLFGSTYCAIKTRHEYIRLRISGYSNEDAITLSLVPGETYYVLLETSMGIFDSRYTVALKKIDKDAGEQLLMKDVSSLCPQPLMQ